MISWAQNYEDVMLARALRDVKTGRYIDVGAWHPTEHSVTKHFYDLGWSGINIEPGKRWFDLLVTDRPRDVNLNVAVGSVEGTKALYEFGESGFGTLSEEYRDIFKTTAGEPSRVEVRVTTLKRVCEEHVRETVDFLKIDAEGWEVEVIKGADWKAFRPRIVVVEATRPNSPQRDHEGWEPLLLAERYERAYFDGLNMFYVRTEEPELKTAFQSPPNIFDEFRPISVVRVERELERARAANESLGRQVKDRERETADLEARARRGEEESRRASSLAEEARDRLGRAERDRRTVQVELDETARALRAAEEGRAQARRRAQEAEAEAGRFRGEHERLAQHAQAAEAGRLAAVGEAERHARLRHEAEVARQEALMQLEEHDRRRREAEERVKKLGRTLADVEGSLAWRIVGRLRRFKERVAPSYTRRRGAWDLAVKAVGVVRREGWKAFFKRAYGWIGRTAAGSPPGAGLSRIAPPSAPHAIAARSRAPRDPRDFAGRAFGVNYYGFISTENGMGSATRGNVSALRSQGVPMNLIDIPSGRRAADGSYPGAGRTAPVDPYRLTIVHQNADMTEGFLSRFGWKALEDGYAIGLWIWELQAFRQDWQRCFLGYDEIWTASTFCQKALAAGSPVPVVHMPYVVDGLEARAVHDRTFFGIPEGVFIFAYVFDVGSTMARKNPDILVEAFRRTFGGSQNAVLVLKMTNSDLDRKAVRRLYDAVGDLNVKIIDRYLDYGEVISLIQATDCYVSPHRSEGFGLTIAEAMYFGKPVIATRYSANLDFMTEQNSYLLDCTLVPLEQHHGPYLKGNVWAEPSLDHLCRLMREVYEDRPGRETRGRFAASHIRTHYNARAVGAAMNARFAALGLSRET